MMTPANGRRRAKYVSYRGLESPLILFVQTATLLIVSSASLITTIAAGIYNRKSSPSLPDDTADL